MEIGQNTPEKNLDDISVISLLTAEGKAKFAASITTSKGNAAIVIHPFCAESNSENEGTTSSIEDDQDYQKYLRNLKLSVTRYRNHNLPLILFEEETSTNELKPILNRLGITNGDVFFVPTHSDTPEPVAGNLSELANKLKTTGLNRASVIGSYLTLWAEDRETMDDVSPLPQIAQKYEFEGCVGYTIETLLRSGVIATPGVAAYPRDIQGVE